MNNWQFAIGLAGFIVTIFGASWLHTHHIDKRFESLDKRLDEMSKRFDGRIDEMGKRVDGRIDEMGRRIESRVAAVEVDVKEIKADLKQVFRPVLPR
ncbi:MAG: hypothetical protein HOP19_17925 [Acidobacteria bacterium]|nr:hypothetical protein [Acidobacteriota bacterium]